MKTKVSILISFLLSVCSYCQNSKIPIERGQLHVESYGQGTPLLIINGGPGMSSEGFRPLARRLGKNYNTIIFDQRGTGQSNLEAIDSSTITMHQMAEDIERIRQHLGMEQWVVMGHSFGGMLAAYYTSLYPDRVSALILSSSGGLNLDLLETLDITGRLTENRRDSLRFWTTRIREGDTSYHARLQRGRYLAPAYLYDKSHVPVIAERLTQGNMTINGLVFRNMIDNQFDISESLRTFDKPVLIIQGADDIIDVRISEHAEKIFPDAQLIILERCGHYGWLDREEAYFKHLNKFLDALP